MSNKRRRPPWYNLAARKAYDERMKNRTPTTPTMALNTLARHDLTLADTTTMTDEQLLALPNFGRKSLEYVRKASDHD